METAERDGLQIFSWTNWRQVYNKTMNEVTRHKIWEYYKGFTIKIFGLNSSGIYVNNWWVPVDKLRFNCKKIFSPKHTDKQKYRLQSAT